MLKFTPIKQEKPPYEKRVLLIYTVAEEYGEIEPEQCIVIARRIGTDLKGDRYELEVDYNTHRENRDCILVGEYLDVVAWCSTDSVTQE